MEDLEPQFTGSPTSLHLPTSCSPKWVLSFLFPCSSSVPGRGLNAETGRIRLGVHAKCIPMPEGVQHSIVNNEQHDRLNKK